MYWNKADEEEILEGVCNKYSVLRVARLLVNGQSIVSIDWHLAYAGSISYSSEVSWRIIANAFMFLREIEVKRYEH
jgi:hypothetical protein